MSSQIFKIDEPPQLERSDKPRVLFLVGMLWGENGITSHMNTLAQGLIRQGWEVALAADIPADLDARSESLQAIQRFNALGIEYFEIPGLEFRPSLAKLNAMVTTVRRLDRVIRDYQPDLLHTHSLSICPYLQIVRLWYHLPLVSSSHLELNADRLDIKMGRFVNQYLNPAFFGDRAIAISSELKQSLERDVRVPPQHIRLNYSGIEDERFRPPNPAERQQARAAFDLPPDAKVVCLLGRLAPVKGHDILIRSLALLRAQGMDVIAICAGKGYGDEAATLRAQNEAAGVADLVRLVGVADARQVLWATDILTLPSRREGFPTVIIEAMFCGIVPIRTPAAGAGDQIADGENGFIVPFDDPPALALRIGQLLEDETLRSRMSAAAVSTAQQKFTVDRMTNGTIAIYEEAIAARA